MDVLAISPENEWPDEALVIERLLDAGLFRYHLRKPVHRAAQIASLLERVPSTCRKNVVVHQHREHVTAFGLAGYHFKDRVGATEDRDTWRAQPASSHLGFSRSLHRIDKLADACQGWNYVLISPVFPSITKTVYRPDWNELELGAALRSSTATSQRYALGGVCAANTARCLELGFDGVVLHGALWRAIDPVAELKNCLKRMNG